MNAYLLRIELSGEIKATNSLVEDGILVFNLTPM